jgi:predicted GH43/DUF377 family glycosyl hydrolase
MRWQKKGLIYCATGAKPWSALYAMMPTPVLLPDRKVIRIYAGVTSSDKFGRTIAIDLDKDDPSIVIAIYDDEPVLDLGEPGSFDDSGAVPSSVLIVDEVEYLYYVGFQRTQKVPYMLFPGLAVKEPGKAFKKHSQAPIMDRASGSPVSLAAPSVMHDRGKYRMWLWIGQKWINVDDKLFVQATIGCAESDDAISWRIVKHDCIVPRLPEEFSVGRPWVVKEDGMYKMYYSVRFVRKMYRLGYAESADGLNWIRKDEQLGLSVSEEGWDSNMICYPSVITVGERTYMFYNGNNNGETGFGWAEKVS